MQIGNDGIGTYFSHIVNALNHYIIGMQSIDLIWLSIGLAGQCLFMARFIVQWIHSERHQQSLIPVKFLVFKFAGRLDCIGLWISQARPRHHPRPATWHYCLF